MDAEAARRLEDKLDRLSFAVRCLVGHALAGEFTDRAALREQLVRAEAGLAPEPRRPVVSDPDGGPPVPS